MIVVYLPIGGGDPRDLLADLAAGLNQAELPWALEPQARTDLERIRRELQRLDQDTAELVKLRPAQRERYETARLQIRAQLAEELLEILGDRVMRRPPPSTLKDPAHDS